MPISPSLKPKRLNDNGLNVQCVFNINELPIGIIKPLSEKIEEFHKYSQLILVGHRGKLLWASLPNADSLTDAPANSNPIDSFTIETVSMWLTTTHPNLSFRVIYPGNPPVNLIALGKLAGWHHESPFKVGINNHWGSWFAYRSVILANSDFAITQPLASTSPCSTCKHKICIDHCPAAACNEGELELNKCISYRKSANSQCSRTCLARVSCPVKSEHRYTEPQLNYHYTESMKIINLYNL
ncbi:hypothetical protein [Alkalimarinus alittae]|uniref:4Fe-4S ferredoxin-type domain-containing protein n=1 Tax=Alkalimarinus alittae TaxID=2961619 RepID=A0ABY6N4Z1_9ALTE|nr:hypothetical protein [Alkalimarinus alittae]UZE97052.1 hypothetical protein NKI27_04700 [Alkalimarinus alittae]